MIAVHSFISTTQCAIELVIAPTKRQRPLTAKSKDGLSNRTFWCPGSSTPVELEGLVLGTLTAERLSSAGVFQELTPSRFRQSLVDAPPTIPKENLQAGMISLRFEYSDRSTGPSLNCRTDLLPQPHSHHLDSPKSCTGFSYFPQQ